MEIQELLDIVRELADVYGDTTETNVTHIEVADRNGWRAVEVHTVREEQLEDKLFDLGEED